MFPSRRLTRLLMPTVLIALAVVLAALQYRWLGQVSDAERVELQASLERRARDMGAAFDREVATLQDLVRSATNGFAAPTPARVAEALDTWRRAARYPGLIRALYAGHRDGAVTTLHRFDDTTHTFEPTPWPDAWPVDLVPRSTSERTVERSATGLRATAEITTFRSPVVISDPLLYVMWLPTRMQLSTTELPRLVPIPPVAALASDFVVVALDRSVLTEIVLPALSARHFGGGRTHVAVRDPHGQAVFSTDSPPVSEDAADVRVPLFTTMPELPGPGADGLVAWATTPVKPDAPAPRLVEEQNHIAIRVDRQTGNVSDVLASMARPWQILVQHEAGSLESAVAAGRRRNLWLSFGILGVLAAGTMLVLVNARRSERLAAQQVDFVAAVSHELRTPLSVIRSAAQNLSSGVVNEPERTREYGVLIEREGRRLTEMVEQVLGYAGINAMGRHMAKRPVDVAATVDAALSACAGLVDTHGVRIDRRVDDGLPLVAANEAALQRALQNMIENAMKYAGGGKWLRIQVERGTHGSRPAVHVVVADRGPGIPAADLSHVFDPFYRGRDAIDRQIPGSGIGLSLVKKVADTHDGAVTVQSSPRGTTFTLTLPALSTADVSGARERPRT